MRAVKPHRPCATRSFEEPKTPEAAAGTGGEGGWEGGTLASAPHAEPSKMVHPNQSLFLFLSDTLSIFLSLGERASMAGERDEYKFQKRLSQSLLLKESFAILHQARWSAFSTASHLL